MRTPRLLAVSSVGLNLGGNHGMLGTGVEELSTALSIPSLQTLDLSIQVEDPGPSTWMALNLSMVGTNPSHLVRLMECMGARLTFHRTVAGLRPTGVGAHRRPCGLSTRVWTTSSVHPSTASPPHGGAASLLRGVIDPFVWDV